MGGIDPKSIFGSTPTTDSFHNPFAPTPEHYDLIGTLTMDAFASMDTSQSHYRNERRPAPRGHWQNRSRQLYDSTHALEGYSPLKLLKSSLILTEEGDEAYRKLANMDGSIDPNDANIITLFDELISSELYYRVGDKKNRPALELKREFPLSNAPDPDFVRFLLAQLLPIKQLKQYALTRIQGKPAPDGFEIHARESESTKYLYTRQLLKITGEEDRLGRFLDPGPAPLRDRAARLENGNWKIALKGSEEPTFLEVSEQLINDIEASWEEPQWETKPILEFLSRAKLYLADGSSYELGMASPAHIILLHELQVLSKPLAEDLMTELIPDHYPLVSDLEHEMWLGITRDCLHDQRKLNQTIAKICGQRVGLWEMIRRQLEGEPVNQMEKPSKATVTPGKAAVRVVPKLIQAKYPAIPDPSNAVEGLDSVSHLPPHSKYRLTPLTQLQRPSGVTDTTMGERIRCGALDGTFYSLNTIDWSEVERCTFVQTGRGMKTHVPEESGAGRVVLVISPGDFPKNFDPQSLLSSHRDVLVIRWFDERKGNEPIVQRLSSLTFADHCKLKHAIVLEDNIVSVHAKASILDKTPSWALCYKALQKATEESELASVGVHPVRGGRWQGRELSSQHIETQPSLFGSQISFYNLEYLRAHNKRGWQEFLTPKVGLLDEAQWVSRLLEKSKLPFGSVMRQSLVVRRNRQGSSLRESWDRITDDELKKLPEEFRTVPGLIQVHIDACVKYARQHGSDGKSLKQLVAEYSGLSEEVLDDEKVAAAIMKAAPPKAPMQEGLLEAFAERLDRYLKGDHTLREPQERCLEELSELLKDSKHPSGYFSMATGIGKTVTFLTMVDEILPLLNKGQHCLIIAPTIVLAEQAAERYESEFNTSDEANDSITVCTGNERSPVLNTNVLGKANPGVVFTCQQSLMAAIARDPNILKHFAAIFGDELHKLNHDLLGLLNAHSRENSALNLGFSATPGRKNLKCYASSDPIFSFSLLQALELSLAEVAKVPQGNPIVCPWKFHPILDISTQEQRDPSLLAEKIRDALQTADEQGKPFSDSKGIISVRSVSAAVKVAKNLGSWAEPYHSKLSSVELKTTLEQYKDKEGETTYLVTVRMLREGFDDPGTTIVVIAQKLDPDEIEQLLGRAVRWDKRNPDKIAHIVLLNSINIPKRLKAENLGKLKQTAKRPTSRPKLVARPSTTPSSNPYTTSTGSRPMQRMVTPRRGFSASRTSQSKPSSHNPYTPVQRYDRQHGAGSTRTAFDRNDAHRATKPFTAAQQQPLSSQSHSRRPDERDFPPKPHSDSQRGSAGSKRSASDRSDTYRAPKRPALPQQKLRITPTHSRTTDERAPERGVTAQPKENRAERRVSSTVSSTTGPTSTQTSAPPLITRADFEQFKTQGTILKVFPLNTRDKKEALDLGAKLAEIESFRDRHQELYDRIQSFVQSGATMQDPSYADLLEQIRKVQVTRLTNHNLHPYGPNPNTRKMQLLNADQQLTSSPR